MGIMLDGGLRGMVKEDELEGMPFSFRSIANMEVKHIHILRDKKIDTSSQLTFWTNLNSRVNNEADVNRK